MPSDSSIDDRGRLAAGDSPPRISDFQARVYAAVCRIPCGKVATYGAVALAIGCRSPRAVGQALRRNPFAPEVPCHRVVAADLKIGGFAGQRSGREVRRKHDLLRAEGVRIVDGRMVGRECLFAFH